MNRIKYALTLASSLLISWSSLSAATQAVTDPVGVVEIDVAGFGYTFAGIPLVNETSFVGSAVSVSSNTVTFDADPFTSGEFDEVIIGSENVPQYIFEVTSGSDVGAMIPIISNDSATITLSEDVSAFISSGTTGKIRALPTLDSLFPEGGPLTSGFSAAAADQILVFDSETQTSKSYFYYSFLGTDEWRSGATPNGLRSILPNQSIYINRKGPATKVRFTGSVKTGTTAIDILPGYNLIPNPYPVAYTFNLSDLYTGDSTTGVASGFSAAVADEVIIYDANATPTVYFYYSFLGTEEWRSGATATGEVEIPAGGALMVNRKGGRGPFSWVKTQPF